MTADYSTILAAVSVGGSNALSSVTPLLAAAGAQATVAPAALAIFLPDGPTTVSAPWKDLLL